MTSTNLQRGGNIALSQIAPGVSIINVALAWAPRNIAGMEVDASAFLLAADDKVRGDEDMVFYNNPRIRDGSVEALSAAGTDDAQIFVLNLNAIPGDVQKIAFTVTIHEGQARNQNFGMLTLARARVTNALDQTELVCFELPLSGATETAMIFCEVYRYKDGWKFKAVGQGYVGGLAPLATAYGIDVAQDEAASAPSPPPAPAADKSRTVQLQKRIIDLEKKDKSLVSLVKSAGVQLEKRGLRGHQAKVALCLDISGSMHKLYQKGSIDEFVRRVLALGFLFDDDGAIDVFLFGSNAHHYGAVTVDNYKTFVKDMLRRHSLEGGTAYGKVIQMVREHYRHEPGFGRVPIYVMFTTDGDTHDRQITEQQMKEASGEGIFWQFMAIGEPPGEKRGFFSRLLSPDFSFLSHLDSMDGRVVDNANFFLVRDPAEPTDEQLYELLMAEYPLWLQAARSKAILS